MDTLNSVSEERILSYLNGKLEEKEKQEFLEWLNESHDNLSYFSEIKALHNRIGFWRLLSKKDFRKELRRLNATIDSGKNIFARRSKLVFWATAASVLLVLGLSLFQKVVPDEPVQVFASVDGQQKKIRLQDGTHVWLSPRSEIRYNPETFLQDRRVMLDGEALFDVAHDPACPFVVTTSHVNVKVLGTIFTINSFSNVGRSETTLAEGSIELQNSKGSYLVTLTPGQKAVYEEDKLTVQEICPDDMIMMKYGIQTIRDASIPEILRNLENDFGVCLKAVSYTPKDTLFTISYMGDAKLEDVLDMLETISGSKFKIDE